MSHGDSDDDLPPLDDFSEVVARKKEALAKSTQAPKMARVLDVGEEQAQAVRLAAIQAALQSTAPTGGRAPQNSAATAEPVGPAAPPASARAPAVTDSTSSAAAAPTAKPAPTAAGASKSVAAAAAAASKAPKPDTAADDEDFFPGLKAGFLLKKKQAVAKAADGGTAGKPAAAKPAAKPAAPKDASPGASKGPSKGTDGFGDAIPFIRSDPAAAAAAGRPGALLPEVQAAVGVSGRAGWVTGDLLSAVSGNEALMRGMSDPKLMAIVTGEMSKDPAGTMRKYQNDKKVTDFIELWISTMSGFAGGKPTPAAAAGTRAGPGPGPGVQKSPVSAAAASATKPEPAASQQRQQQQQQQKAPGDGIRITGARTSAAIGSGTATAGGDDSFSIVRRDTTTAKTTAKTATTVESKGLEGSSKIRIVDSDEEDGGAIAVTTPAAAAGTGGGKTGSAPKPSAGPSAGSNGTGSGGSSGDSDGVYLRSSRPTPAPARAPASAAAASGASAFGDPNGFTEFNGRQVPNQLLARWLSHPMIRAVLNDPATNALIARTTSGGEAQWPQVLKDPRGLVLVAAGIIMVPEAHKEIANAALKKANIRF